MIKLVNFLLLSKRIVNFDKNDIDQGNTPPKIYEICSCIRDIFCLSYSIRKNNNLFLYFVENHYMIKLIGSELRYLGSDERSQALLLNKAINLIQKRHENDWIYSTPGIYAKYYRNKNKLLDELAPDKFEEIIWIIDSKDTQKFRKITYLEKLHKQSKINNSLFIITLFKLEDDFPFLIKWRSSITNMKLFSTNQDKGKKPQDKILYFNFYLDSLEESDNLR
ncbi:MAG: hypothetical protein EU543_02390 [Promethearchaeota archaeon]|nr:MAG: hypothetical protein EU543_02390 [Candidatus Lokiarchaeota archaeon]